MKDASIYVHIPFCKSKCIYCDFVSFSNCQNSFDTYCEAIIKELKLQSVKFKNVNINTIYFGGGTPSVYPTKYITAILAEINASFCVVPNVELTIEVNPDSATEKVLNGFVKLGFNRFSIGLQTSDNNILKVLNRPHTRKDYIKAVTILNKLGITNISTDIMLGLPNQTIATIDETLDLLINLNIPHISAYSLKVEHKTPLYNLVKEKKIVLPDEDESVNMYDHVQERLQSNKIYRYEVSNFAQVGYESKHNLNYWQWGRYLGVGLNASSFINDTRIKNVKNLNIYISKLLTENKVPVSERKKLCLREAELEYIMLNLRLESGLNIEKFNNLFYTDFIKRFDTRLKKLEKIGVIVYDEHFVNVKKEKMYVLNSIILEFFD